MDWHTWHDLYDTPNSSLGRRLLVVQQHVRAALDAYPAGPIGVISVCAGQGRDLIEVLAGHPRAADVTARLVELDPRNVAVARRAAAAAKLDRVGVVEGDAALTRLYGGAAPADLVLMCGVFGNITDDDVLATVDHCAALCRRGGTLVWTRHRKAPDLVPRICDRLEASGFDRRFLSEPDAGYGVGVHHRTAEPRALAGDARMFTFVGYDALAASRAPAAPGSSA
ncbi:methyltransferase domain-containing protein [Actinacidiphila paucisporea]|uniref:Methyltransferase domain-containing protein n=1 Tax=Actinacidiphila paucisporea TaxID=310782 RepID=A0A1M6XXT9_9ACTN|nr:class I SAM-dependent methyltransferase [Actinacidiphila paucisporea]SHL10862.1 Methyltransferase domain-containing protein [Actinacidiphila paucisporea]